MKKRTLLFFIGIISVCIAYFGIKNLTKDVVNDILNLDNDLEF